MTGYQKFKEAGDRLKLNKPVEKPIEELKAELKKITDWLETHDNHPRYEEGNEKAKQLEHKIRVREALKI